MKSDYQQFYNTVMEYYGEYGRYDLPWRFKIDRKGNLKYPKPYHIVVSEIMLQQTQVDRVIPFFNTWIKQFPSWKALSNAKQSEVLKYWKGLGYNSRALRLHKLAQIVSREYGGRLPQDFELLKQLPGIGPYTAGAIIAFAFDKYIPIIETNIRRVFIHHFFNNEQDVADSEIMRIMNDMGEIESSLEWYAALMDYGSHLPKIVKYNPNRLSKHYTKQSKFKGSDREIRGNILEILLAEKSLSKKDLFKKLGGEGGRYERILEGLEREGFLGVEGKSVLLS